MNNERQVSLKVLFGLLRGKRPLAMIGVIFTCVSVFVFLPMMLIISSTLKEPYEKYDFQGIQKNGLEKSAKITFIKPINNVTVNGEHPVLISYDFENNGHTATDKFETFDSEKITDYTIGKEISILAYQNQTMIKGLKPFAFPFYIFFLFPVIFLIIGIPLLLIGLIPSLKTFNLYKSGIVKDAHIVSVEANNGVSSFRGLRQLFSVNYYFLNGFGSKVFGESTTHDILFLNDKKAGDKIKIFVSPSDETKTCLIPTLEAMKYNWNI